MVVIPITTTHPACEGIALLRYCYTDGTSGSPLLAGINQSTGLGTVIGVISGYQQGGDTPSVQTHAASGSGRLVIGFPCFRVGSGVASRKEVVLVYPRVDENKIASGCSGPRWRLARTEAGVGYGSTFLAACLLLCPQRTGYPAAPRHNVTRSSGLSACFRCDCTQLGMA